MTAGASAGARGGVAAPASFGRFHVNLLFWAASAQFLEGFEMQLVGYTAPVMADALHVSKFAFGWVFAANNAGFLLGAIGLSSLGDRVGRRRMLVAGVLTFGVFTLAIGYSTTLWQVLAFRVLSGIGLGGAVPNIIALVAEYAPARRRATALSALFVAYTAGSFVCGFVASWVLGHGGWELLFRMGGWAGLALAPLLVWRLPESVNSLIRRGDPAGAAAVMRRIDPGFVWTGPAAFAVSPTDEAGTSVRTLFTHGRAAGTLALWAAAICSMVSLHLLTSWLPTVIKGFGVPTTLAVLIGSMFHLGGTVANVVVGRAIDRRGPVVVALTLLVAGPVVWLLGLGAGTPVLLAVLVAASGFFVAGGQNGINALSGLMYPEALRASGSGWVYGVGRIGSIIGPVMGGALISAHLPDTELFVIFGVPLVLAGGSLLVLSRASRPIQVAPRELTP